jgi:acyl-CoA thioester hydrolase
VTGSPPHRTVELDLEIYTFDIDFAAHVSNITYIRWLEIARLQLLIDIGIPTPDLLERGVAPVLMRTEIDYKSPLVLGEPVHLSLWLTELRAASATLAFRITSGERLAATAVQRGLFVNTANGRPSRLSSDDRSRLQPYLETSPREAVG